MLAGAIGTLQIFVLELASSLLLFGLIAWWYAWPRLRDRPRSAALIPLLFVHCFRTVGMSLLVPQIGTNMPAGVAAEIGYGDLVAAVLALVSILALRYRPGTATALVWIFSLWGMADLANAMYVGVSANLVSYQLATGWYIVTYFVPLLWVTHVLIVLVLLRKARG